MVALSTSLLALALAAQHAQHAHTRLASHRTVVTPRNTINMIAPTHTPTTTYTQPDSTQQHALLSGLNGKALDLTLDDIPTKAQIRAVVPAHCFRRDTLTSLRFLAQSLAAQAAVTALGLRIPLTLAATPLWAAYALAAGTLGTGLWVLAHECGHGAFLDNRLAQNTIGYVLHSALLVPYFSWQRSHAVHHANTNHISDGETHVPVVVGGDGVTTLPGGETVLGQAAAIGKRAMGALQLALHLIVGWPAYLLWGATGGPKYGVSNHFVPRWPFSAKLWPGNFAKKVVQSDWGIVATLGALGVWASKAGLAKVFALYGAPLLVVNAWLVAYTWLQHTDVDVPHLSADEFSFMRGAFLSIDRPYGALFDWCHHRIGSTHVAHHIDCTIPHYHAREATDAIKAAFPKAYLYDPTPVHKALWRVSQNCLAVQPDGKGRFQWVPAYGS